MGVMNHRLSLPVFLFVLLLSTSAQGAEATPADKVVAAGQALLQKNCARCHVIGMEGESPNPKSPPFREVAKRYDPGNLEEALAEGIVTGHNEMPEFVFDADQIAEIVAYLRALGGQQ